MTHMKRESGGRDYRTRKFTFFTARRLIELLPTTPTPLPLSLSDWIATAEKVREGTPARRGGGSVEEMTLHLNGIKLDGNFPKVLSNNLWSEIHFMRRGGEQEHFPIFHYHSKHNHWLKVRYRQSPPTTTGRFHCQECWGLVQTNKPVNGFKLESGREISFIHFLFKGIEMFF